MNEASRTSQWHIAVGDAQTTAVFERARQSDTDTVFICAHGAGGQMNDRGMLALAEQLRGERRLNLHGTRAARQAGDHRDQHGHQRDHGGNGRRTEEREIRPVLVHRLREHVERLFGSAHVLDMAARVGVRVIVDPVSVAKAGLAERVSLHLQDYRDISGQFDRIVSIEMVEAACAIPTTIQGRIAEDVARNVDAETVRQPVGVCAAIVPFNFPAMVPFWFLPFAIACGNTFVLKPSEQVPLTQELVFNLIDDLGGLPAGLRGIVAGATSICTVGAGGDSDAETA